MSCSLIISETAEQDITDAFLWYEKQKDDLGGIFEHYVNKVINEIGNSPSVFQIRYLDVRIAFLYRFPYGIHFTFTDDIITVIGVYHTSLNPNKWLDK